MMHKKNNKLLGTFETKGMEEKRMKYDWWSELERENMGG